MSIGGELIRRGRDRPESLDAVRSMLRHVEADLAPPATDPAAMVAHRVLGDVAWYAPI